MGILILVVVLLAGNVWASVPVGECVLPHSNREYRLVVVEDKNEQDKMVKELSGLAIHEGRKLYVIYSLDGYQVPESSGYVCNWVTE